MIVKFICFCLMVSVIFAGDKVDDLTPEERQDIFHTQDENAYEYEILPIVSRKVSRQKRSDTSKNDTTELQFEFVTRGKLVNLHLKETEESVAGHEVPIFSAQTGANGLIIEKDNGMRKNLRTYENLDHVASLVVEENPESGDRTFTGVIGSENLAVKPLPSRLTKVISRRRRSVDGNGESLTNTQNYHIVYKVPETPVNSKSPENMDLIMTSMNLTYYNNPSRRIPTKIYAELMIVVDNQLHKMIGNNNNDTIRYILSYYSSVDLRFRSLNLPEIGISVAGIIIADNHQTLSYLRDHEIHNSEYFNAQEALQSGHTFWSNRKDVPTNSYDGLITMTSSQFCFTNNSECVLIWGLAGISICDAGWNHAIIGDSGLYKTILVAAHELGHLLGASNHDDACVTSAERGTNLMSSRAMTKVGYWSACAINELKNYHFSGDRSCLYNKPRQSEKSTAVLLPGMVRSRDQQCKKAFTVPAWYPTGFSLIPCPGNTECGILQCGWSQTQLCFPSEIIVLDGTPCSDGKGICISTECIIISHLNPPAIDSIPDKVFQKQNTIDGEKEKRRLIEEILKLLRPFKL